MAVLRLAVLLQGLLLAARCEVRARDPEVEEEDLKDMSDGAGWTHEVPLVGFGAPHNVDGLNKSPDVYGAIHHPLDHKHHDPNHGHPSLDVPMTPTAETVSHGSLQRTGNWCAFVHKRAVSVAVACGTEKFIIKSQSPCPNGTPDCQIVMYKISTRPVYRQKEKIYTALQWRCCPGHAGEGCEDTVTDGRVSDSEDPIMASHPNLRGHENSQGHNVTEQLENQNREHFEMLDSPLNEAQRPDAENQTTAESTNNNEHSHHTGHEHHHHQDLERTDPHAIKEEISNPETFDLHPGLLPILKEAVLSQLQPVLDNFNLTLENLFQEVQFLQQDMARLRHQQGQFDGEEHDQKETVEAELKKSLQNLEEVKAQFHNHRSEIEEKLHAQHSMLVYNLTNFKTEMDLKIKRNQKMLQVNLQSLNSSMVEVKQEQERLDEELQRVWPEKTLDPQPHESTAVWEAITRLDNKVMNNTVGISALTEGQEQVIPKIEDLQSGWRNLEERIAKTGREYQIKYMETGLEVDAAKVSVLEQIKELSSNVSAVQNALLEVEVDVDYLFTQYYKNISSSTGDCNCLDLRTSVTQLEKNFAYVMEIANENRLARQGEAEIADNDGAWVPSVDDLKQGLLNVQKSLAFEQEKSRMLQHNTTQLQTSLLGSQQDIEALQEQDRAKVEKIQQLASTFNTLLQDAIRHSEILELLLGEEVLEFMEGSHQDKRHYSISALRESIKDMQAQINGHSLSLASMLNPAGPAADEPSMLEDWPKRRLGDQKFDQFEEQPEYSDIDFWTLEKTVKELSAHIRHLEERRCLSCCNCTKSATAADVEVRLEEEVATLRKNLEVHLEVFNRIFSNTERLVGTDASVDLDQLSALLKRKEAKQQKNKKTKRPKRGLRGNIRSRRDASLESAVLRQLPKTPFMFLASTTDGANRSGTVLFERVALNHGQIYSPKTGTFHAPASGVYLFVVTLDFGPGPSLAQLRRGGDVVASLRQLQKKLGAPATRVCILQLQQGEELHLELLQGNVESGNQKDNTFAGLLMLQTT
ncbi:Multimerin-2 [Triplophysa tibetana]|uniref:Multimerin-2 n=1 Tax=Triplophysa tibetana TaxID=1572043 RepID=A0A5A9P7E5_9TELE|nr:Multimerin-2 [Triplophysa tibetana]